MKNKRKVIVGMSGGVDSSVAALILKNQGYAVEGLFMKNWDEDDDTDYCTAKEDLKDAKNVCDKIGIKLNTANFAPEYWDNVFEEFLSEFDRGRTPNPDILCNREIKFKVFRDYAQSLGAELVATGHYAQLSNEQGIPKLLKGLDENKDQSYFLNAVPSKAFENVLFPLGKLIKSEVREIAEKNDLKTFNKKDSTGICFIGERRFADFLGQYKSKKPGNITDENGRILGVHEGLMFFTIGQRQGIKIGGIKDSYESPWYVLDKNLDTNELIIGQGNSNPKLYTKLLFATDINWINESLRSIDEFKCHAKIRYRQNDQKCTIQKVDNEYEVLFEVPQRAVAPGQSVVFYSGDECLGGGVIDRVAK